MPLVAKDTLKETLASQLGTQGRDASFELGAAVFHLMATVVPELLAHGVSLICEGNFVAESVVFRELPPARIVQVHVSARPEVLRERLVNRDPDRHPVHYDREAADEIVALAAAGKWEPVPLGGELIRIDGTRPLDVAELTSVVRRM